MYVYIRSEPGLYTVGHYAPDGSWVAESDHEGLEAAAERVHWLNGGGQQLPESIQHALNSGDGTYRP